MGPMPYVTDHAYEHAMIHPSPPRHKDSHLFPTIGARYRFRFPQSLKPQSRWGCHGIVPWTAWHGAMESMAWCHGEAWHGAMGIHGMACTRLVCLIPLALKPPHNPPKLAQLPLQPVTGVSQGLSGVSITIFSGGLGPTLQS